MKKQIVIVGIIALLICIGLSGCTNQPSELERNEERSKFFGAWKYIDPDYKNVPYYYDFFSDGTGYKRWVSEDVRDTIWTINGDVLSIRVPASTGHDVEYTDVYHYKFLNDTALQLTDEWENVRVFNKW